MEYNNDDMQRPYNEKAMGMTALWRYSLPYEVLCYSQNSIVTDSYHSDNMPCGIFYTEKKPTTPKQAKKAGQTQCLKDFHRIHSVDDTRIMTYQGFLINSIHQGSCLIPSAESKRFITAFNKFLQQSNLPPHITASWTQLPTYIPNNIMQAVENEDCQVFITCCDLASSHLQKQPKFRLFSEINHQGNIVVTMRDRVVTDANENASYFELINPLQIEYENIIKNGIACQKIKAIKVNDLRLLDNVMGLSYYCKTQLNYFERYLDVCRPLQDTRPAHNYQAQLPALYYIKNNFRYVFADSKGRYHTALLALQSLKLITEYLPLMVADFSLALIDTYRKIHQPQTLRQPWRCLSSIIVLTPLILVHYLAKLIYFLGYALTSPYASYCNHYATHPLLGYLSVVVTLLLNITLGMIIAPWIGPSIAWHLASSHFLYQVGAILSPVSTLLHTYAAYTVTALSTLCQVSVGCIITPWIAHISMEHDRRVTDLLRLRTQQAYQNTVLPLVREIQAR